MSLISAQEALARLQITEAGLRRLVQPLTMLLLNLRRLDAALRHDLLLREKIYTDIAYGCHELGEELLRVSGTYPELPVLAPGESPAVIVHAGSAVEPAVLSS